MQKLKPFLLILLAAIAGGGTSTLSKIASAEVPTITFNFLRFALATAILLPLFPILKIKINTHDWGKITLISLLAVLNPFLFFVGIKHTSAMMGQMIYTILPLVTIIFAYLIGQETITHKKIIGITIGLIGALIIILQPAAKEISLSGGTAGNLIIFSGMSSFALYSVLIRKYQSTHSPLELNFCFIAVAFFITLLLLPIDLATGPAWWHTITLPGTLRILYVGIIGTGIYYLIMQYALKASSALTTSTTLYIQPLFSFLWASALLGEHLTLDLIIGGTLAFIGIGLVMTRQKTA